MIRYGYILQTVGFTDGLDMKWERKKRRCQGSCLNNCKSNHFTKLGTTHWLTNMQVSGSLNENCFGKIWVWTSDYRGLENPEY